VNSLDGKGVVITGGAGGIGEATVKLFVEQGAQVLIADVDDQKGMELADSLGPAAHYQRTNVLDEANIAQTLGYAADRFGRLDFLFNNVGGGANAPARIEDVPLKVYQHIMNLTVRSAFLGMKHAAPIMKRQGFGSIANNASIAGVIAGYATHLYSAAKSAVIQMTRSVAMELGESNIRVNCICPGGVLTPMLVNAFGIPEEHFEQRFELLKTALSYNQPIRRPCYPEDVAQAALWLAGDESGFINGHALVVDGGLTGGRQWSFSQIQQQD
jgi:NAD(P)-dependent dehydrogenase (short-subunit alcohol dehydrogenase family)